jgi:hypothetical protein
MYIGACVTSSPSLLRPSGGPPRVSLPAKCEKRDGKKRWTAGRSAEGYGRWAFVYTSRFGGSSSSGPNTIGQPQGSGPGHGPR